MLNWLWKKLWGISFDDASKELRREIDEAPITERQRHQLRLDAAGLREHYD